MIDTIIQILGYTGSDPVVTYIVAACAGVLTICLAYKFTDFLFTFILSLFGRSRDKINF